MEEPTASELLAQAHEEQELKEAANRRGDSKAALAHAKARRRALDAACHTAAGREAQRLLRSGGAKAPERDGASAAASSRRQARDVMLSTLDLWVEVTMGGG